MNIFEDYLEKLVNHGFKLIPTENKVPTIKKWDFVRGLNH